MTKQRLVRSASAGLTLSLIVLGGCYDQAFVPDDEANGSVVVTNDEIELEQRYDSMEVDVPIEPPPMPLGMTPEGWSAALAQMRGPSEIRLTLGGEAASPTVNGEVVQATMIQESDNKNRAIVSYNVVGSAALGAIDVYQIRSDKDPRLRSSASFLDADINAVGVDESFAYAAQASADPSLAAPAVVERFVVTKDKLTLDGMATTQLESFAATSVVSDGSVVYATSGSAGSVYAIDPDDMTVIAQYALDNARWVALDEDNDRVVVAQGTPGRLSVFERDNFTGGSLNLLDTWTFPGANVAEAKTTVEVHGGKAFVAAGPEGVQIVCLDNGQIVGSIPIPDPDDLGLDPSVVVTNAVTVEDEVIFISNGEAGVYAAAADNEFEDTACTDTQEISVLGRLRFDELQSANHVHFRSKRLWVAAGLGGVKIVRVRIRK